MIDKTKCYEILGVRAGVSREELKAAHRDLAKVWHPDRFTHDPRLQAKAQEKLKEINEAFDQLTSKAKRHPATTPRNGQAAETSYQSRKTRASSRVVSHLSHWGRIFVALLLFAVVFFFTSRTLIRRNQQTQDPASSIEQTAAFDIEEQSDRAGTEPSELSRGNNRIKEQSESEESVPQQMTGGDATVLQPVATATVTIDPLTGMVARRECPTKRTMTYPKGNEPHEYCNVHKPLPPLPAEPEESRIKSVTKRLVSPSKW